MKRQQEKAISVICEFDWLDKYFAISRNGRGKVIELGNVDANIDHEV